jgi:RsiW-degrading membrane proteinase PrsW (M82 family)
MNVITEDGMLILLLSAAFPVVVFLIIIYQKDSEKEPKKLLIKSFVWGCLVTIPIVLIELFLTNLNTFENAFWHSFYEAFIVAALVEEGFKFLVLYKIIWKNKEFDQYYDGIVYAVFVSLGFALVENISYVMMFGLGVAVLRALLSVPAHGLFGVIMGYCFANARFSTNNRERRSWLWLAVLVPILFHGLFDFLLFSMEKIEDPGLIGLLFLGFAALMIVMWRLGIKYIKEHHSKDTIQYNHMMPYKRNNFIIYPGSYERFIFLKGTTDEYIHRSIIEYEKLSRKTEHQTHSFWVGKTRDWHVVKVGDTVDFQTYHGLAGWFLFNKNRYGAPAISIGYAKNKTLAVLDYFFYPDPARIEGDSKIGVFRNGISFYIFLPESYEVYGNLTLTNYFKLFWTEITDYLKKNGLNMSEIGNIDYVEYRIVINPKKD